MKLKKSKNKGGRLGAKGNFISSGCAQANDGAKLTKSCSTGNLGNLQQEKGGTSINLNNISESPLEPSRVEPYSKLKGRVRPASSYFDSRVSKKLTTPSPTPSCSEASSDDDQDEVVDDSVQNYLRKAVNVIQQREGGSIEGSAKLDSNSVLGSRGEETICYKKKQRSSSASSSTFRLNQVDIPEENEISNSINRTKPLLQRARSDASYKSTKSDTTVEDAEKLNKTQLSKLNREKKDELLIIDRLTEILLDRKLGTKKKGLSKAEEKAVRAEIEKCRATLKHIEQDISGCKINHTALETTCALHEESDAAIANLRANVYRNKADLDRKQSELVEIKQEKEQVTHELKALKRYSLDCDNTTAALNQQLRLSRAQLNESTAKMSIIDREKMMQALEYQQEVEIRLQAESKLKSLQKEYSVLENKHGLLLQQFERVKNNSANQLTSINVTQSQELDAMKQRHQGEVEQYKCDIHNLETANNQLKTLLDSVYDDYKNSDNIVGGVGVEAADKVIHHLNFLLQQNNNHIVRLHDDVKNKGDSINKLEMEVNDLKHSKMVLENASENRIRILTEKLNQSQLQLQHLTKLNKEKSYEMESINEALMHTIEQKLDLASKLEELSSVA